MIDGVKCVCWGVNPATWLGCSSLDFGTLVSERTGEILSQTKEAPRHGLTFRINKQAAGVGLCSFVGSLHKYGNAGGANINLFSFEDLQRVLLDLQNNYGVNLDCTSVQNLEIGVNIPLSYSPSVVIRSDRKSVV